MSSNHNTTKDSPEAEIVLYDLASTKGVCFSPAVWRIRLLLNYKEIPYRTIWLEFPDIKEELVKLGIPAPPSGKYTVPAIHHIPSETFVMDSPAIAHFLEEKYPQRPVKLSSPLGDEIQQRARGVVGKAFSASILPREMALLSPRSQRYFRETREAALGHPLEGLLAREDAVWESVQDEARAIGALILQNGGPYVLGEEVSMADFFIAGALRNALVVDREVFSRLEGWEGYMGVYEACGKWMEREN